MVATNPVFTYPFDRNAGNKNAICWRQKLSDGFQRMLGIWSVVGFGGGDTVLARGNWAGLGWAGVCGAGEARSRWK